MNDAAERQAYWQAFDTCRDLREILGHMTDGEMLAMRAAIKSSDHCELGRLICKAWGAWFAEFDPRPDRLEEE